MFSIRQFSKKLKREVFRHCFINHCPYSFSARRIRHNTTYSEDFPLGSTRGQAHWLGGLQIFDSLKPDPSANHEAVNIYLSSSTLWASGVAHQFVLKRSPTMLSSNLVGLKASSHCLYNIETCVVKIAWAHRGVSRAGLFTRIAKAITVN
jgi:hypothetical protein